MRMRGTAVLFIQSMILLGIFLDPQSGRAQQGPSPARVVVSPVSEEQVRESITLLGTAEAHRRSEVAAQVAGWVEEVFFQEGDRVDAGRPLARLEDRALKIELSGAVAALKEAEQRFAQASADLERLRPLWASRSIAEKTLQDAEYEVNARRERVEVLRSRVRALEDQLQKKKIRAPFSGWVAERHVEKGEWVDRGDPVANLVDLARIHVKVSVPERYLPSLSVGDPAAVRMDALPGRSFPGRIHSILPRGDAQAHTFPVKVELINPDGAIRAGMLARVTFPVGPRHQALLVPKDALVLTGADKAVFLVNDQKAHRVAVKVLAYHGDQAEVEGDLRPGDLVVVRGNERLRQGQRVTAAADASSTPPKDRP